ncbi:DUF4431 domain-containing protein [Xenorhabdus sp. BG5]|uniref:DUF4431 domain-containing protein n=1 Tax=Xenorhabdus sp. BG5 TaxID=2782014 RepID=UPI00187F2CF9|nr:DUF4431 domain-containing protein [Xenorhabdus sp. BG5]MBE8596868.1 DUF4431 domain-containing protein [Xenorhabdus sp. BG5]
MLKKFSAILFFISGITQSASFDCTKAESKTEKLICSTPVLSQADDALYVDYLQAKLVTGNSADFKALVRQNWKLREKNCDTEECLLGWYKRSTELYRQIAANKQTQEYKTSDTYFYATPVKIRGVLNKESAGFPSLRLDDLISVFPRDGDEVGGDNSPEFGVAVIQLAMSDDTQWNLFEEFKGQKAEVVCNLYHSHTAHHKTPVVCSVGKIIPIKVKPKQDSNPVKQAVSSSKKSLDDFFRDNPSLNGFYVKRAIKMQASGAAAMDSFTSTDSSKSKLKITSDQLSTNGYEYAKLAVRQLQELCSMGMATMHSLKDADCAAIISYKEN